MEKGLTRKRLLIVLAIILIFISIFFLYRHKTVGNITGYASFWGDLYCFVTNKCCLAYCSDGSSCDAICRLGQRADCGCTPDASTQDAWCRCVSTST